MVDTNVVGTIYLLHQLVLAMRDRGQGRMLMTGSIAGLMPGSFQAVDNGTKAFIDSFAWAVRNELGATAANFFERADMLDTKVGASPNGPRRRG